MNNKKLNNDWISVKNKLPNDKQQVLTYYYDKPYDLHQIDMLTYYKKGTVMTRRFDREGETAEQRILNDMFRKDLDVVAKESGFYICEYDEEDQPDYRKHSDCITHWHSLPGIPGDTLK